MPDQEDRSEQEKMAFLLGGPVRGRAGYSFGERMAPNGDIFDIEIVRDSDQAPIGTARGSTVDEILASARAEADSDSGV